jgi:tripartite tricarboxylate transporter TctB family protein
MMALGLVVLVQARRSPPLAEVDWSDLPHAARVAVVGAATVALYEPLGFVLTMLVMLLTLIVLAERRPVLPALAFSVVATAAVYALFALLLRAPFPRGVLGI